MSTTATDLLLAQDDLESLLSADPLDLSDKQLDSLIAHYELKAEQWQNQQKRGAKQAKLQIEGDAKTVLEKLGLGKQLSLPSE